MPSVSGRGGRRPGHNRRPRYTRAVAPRYPRGARRPRRSHSINRAQADRLRSRVRSMEARAYRLAQQVAALPRGSARRRALNRRLNRLHASIDRIKNSRSGRVLRNMEEHRILRRGGPRAAHLHRAIERRRRREIFVQSKARRAETRRLTREMRQRASNRYRSGQMDRCKSYTPGSEGHRNCLEGARNAANYYDRVVREGTAGPLRNSDGAGFRRQHRERQRRIREQNRRNREIMNRRPGR